MKRLYTLIFLLCVCIMLFSCDTKEPADTSSHTNVSSSVDTGSTGSSDISNDSNVDINGNAGTSSSIDESNDTEADIVEPFKSYEKYGDNVYLAFEEKTTNYYANVTNTNGNEESDEKIEEEYEITIITPAEIPKDGKSYFKFIETYDELTTYISSPNIDSSVFENNYIICIKESFYLSSGWEKYFKLLWYSDFKFADNEYEILRNCYFSVEYGWEHLDILEAITIVNYLIIPKTEIDFVEGVHEIAVNDNRTNGDNGLWTDEILGGNENPMPPYTDTHASLSHNEDVVLAKEPTAWVIENGSALEASYGLEPVDKHGKKEFRVVLYLPSEPQFDFLITEKEIKDGNLYITVEEYSQYTNRYLDNNDVKFYDLYIQDTSELSENFNVYVLVKTVK